MSDDRVQDELRRYWDEVAQGQPAARGDLDPGLTETIRRLNDAEDAPGPNPAYAKQLRKDLIRAQTVPVPRDADWRIFSNGRSSPHSLSTWTPRQSISGERRRRVLAQFSTAALLLLTLASIFMIFIRSRPADDQRAFVPSADTPLAISPSPEAGEIEVLLETTLFPDRGSIAIDLSFYRAAIAPGSRATSPLDYATQKGNEVELVLAGTLLVRVDAPIQLVRADTNGVPETVPAGTEITLEEGDAVIMPFDSSREYHNPSDTSAELLGALILPEPWSDIDQWVATDFNVLNGNLFGVVPAADLSSGPLVLTLGRIIDDASAAAPIKEVRPDGGVEWRTMEFDPRRLESHGMGTPPATGAPPVVYFLTLAPAEPRGIPTGGTPTAREALLYS